MTDIEIPEEAVPIPNIPLLRRAVEWAEAEAAKPDLADSQWFQDAYYIADASKIGRRCGTASCIAGYVAEINGGQWASTSRPAAPRLVAEADDHYSINNLISPNVRGQRLLGLTEDEAYELFKGGNTIEDIRSVAVDIAARAGEVL